MYYCFYVLLLLLKYFGIIYTDSVLRMSDITSQFRTVTEKKYFRTATMLFYILRKRRLTKR
jgi:hypothetical protein